MTAFTHAKLEHEGYLHLVLLQMLTWALVLLFIGAINIFLCGDLECLKNDTTFVTIFQNPAHSSRKESLIWKRIESVHV